MADRCAPFRSRVAALQELIADLEGAGQPGALGQAQRDLIRAKEDLARCERTAPIPSPPVPVPPVTPTPPPVPPTPTPPPTASPIATELATCARIKAEVDALLATLEPELADLRGKVEGARGDPPHGILRQIANLQRRISTAKESRCRRVTVHFKSLLAVNPTIVDFITDQFAAMQTLFATGGLIVIQGTTEDLSGDASLRSLLNFNAGECLRGRPTADHERLFVHRNNAARDDVVVYIVSMVVGMNGNFIGGCSTHPDGRPGAVVSPSFPRWIVAHEVAHVLGLNHVDRNRDNLMYTKPNWTNPPPDISANQFGGMRHSVLTRPF